MKAKKTIYNKMQIFCIIPLLLGSTAIMAQQPPGITWEKALGGSGIDIGVETRRNPYGGYISIGFSDSTDGQVTGNHGANDFWLVKQKEDGSVYWQKTYGGSDNDECQSYWSQPGGGYYLAGYTYSKNGDVTFNHGGSDFWVVATNKDGGITWQKTYGGSNDDILYSAWDIGGSEGFVLAGYTKSNDGDVTRNQGKSDFWVVKTNPRGILQWQKTYGGSDDDKCNYIERTGDGGFILAGHTKSTNGDITSNHGDDDYWVLKIGSKGELQWQKTYGGTSDDEATIIKPTNDGGYIIGGSSSSIDGDVTGNHGAADYWIVKINNTGGIQWQKTYGGSDFDFFRSLYQTNDGGYVLIGSSKSNDGDVTGNHGMSDYWVIKIDSRGNKIWEKSLGGSNEDHGMSISKGDNSPFTESYILNGFSASNDGDVTGNHGNLDYWVVKLTATGEAVFPFFNRQKRELTKSEINTILISPNPFQDELHIKSPDQIDRISLYQLTGLRIKEEQVNRKEYHLNTENIPQGTYILYVITKENTTSYKVVKK